jgi:hypothetical protein
MDKLLLTLLSNTTSQSRNYWLVILLPREVVPGALCRESMVEEERHRGSWDEIRQTLLDVGMNRNSCLIEWSRSGIDHAFIKMITGEDTPSNSIWLIPY